MTDRKDFEAAKEQGWNVVLQNPEVAYDPQKTMVHYLCMLK